MARKHVPVALQLYTVRDEAAKDFVATLQRVAAMGYAGVELTEMAGGPSALELRKILDDLGLRCAGSPINLPVGLDDMAAALDFSVALGNRNVFVPMLPKDLREDEEGFRAAVQRLDALGAACRERGLSLAYHNHAFEFQRFGNRYGLDILYDETDPALVKGEPDVYWIAYAGVDPAGWLSDHPGRCPRIHLKDMTAGPERTFAEVGEGVLDFASILVAAEAQDPEWYVVEQDRCARPSLESAALSVQHLKEWGVA